MTQRTPEELKADFLEIISALKGQIQNALDEVSGLVDEAHAGGLFVPPSVDGSLSALSGAAASMGTIVRDTIGFSTEGEWLRLYTPTPT
jgi:hypothetical protein